MRNAKAVWALLVAVLALGVLAVGAALTNAADTLEREGYACVAGGFVLSLIALSLARRARFDYQRTVGRIGGKGLATAARVLATIALVLSLTGALAIAVFVVLDLVA